MQTHERFAYLFRRYLDKTLTPEEVAEMRTYIGQPEYDEELRDLIREGWDQDWPQEEQGPDRAETIFRNIIEQDRGASRLRRLWWWAAAAVTLGAMAGGIYLFRPGMAVREVAQAVPQTMPKTAPDKPEHQYIVLPDQSKVLLNEGSTLEYRNGFTENAREVHLSGEAFFTIRKDTRPFVVNTGKVRTVVLGTSFNIRAYPADKDVTVTVTSGKVKVVHGLRTVGIVQPNEQVKISGIDNAVEKLKGNVEQAADWRKQDLLFDDLPMLEAGRMLEERFRVKFIYAHPALADCHITAAFVRQEPLEDIVKIIARVNNLEFHISGDSVLLSGQGCR
ncbi:FecR domain-containing protein [uncultured Chitinophaga sp.]|jgi:Fe2+-dicitrate sensor, membrane component|uniref:FecR family protein n=1 Tax=uncultured Chitinophaga sp. TaxID=339340 RepID=UPI002630D95C|nr:FecR domain-containing protein [uncultured Chitinophaga sp.]